jgi:predicted DNA-binding transcriptional regulator AlpA
MSAGDTFHSGFFMSTKVLIRFKDLKQRGIVHSWAQLANLIKQENFPTGFYLSANTRCWDESSVESWLATRPAAGGREREVA